MTEYAKLIKDLHNAQAALSRYSQKAKVKDWKQEMAERGRKGGLKKAENLKKRAEALKKAGLLKTG